MNDLMDEKGKTVVITDASKGIGLATSHRLAKAGYQVIGIARTKPSEAFPGEFQFGEQLNQISTIWTKEKERHPSPAINIVVSEIAEKIDGMMHPS